MTKKSRQYLCEGLLRFIGYFSIKLIGRSNLGWHGVCDWLTFSIGNKMKWALILMPSAYRQESVDGFRHFDWYIGIVNHLQTRFLHDCLVPLVKERSMIFLKKDLHFSAIFMITSIINFRGGIIWRTETEGRKSIVSLLERFPFHILFQYIHN